MVPNPGLKITAATFNLYKNPMVYAWTRHGESLYIGKSLTGLSRILHNHHIIGVKEEVQQCDIFVMWYTIEEFIDELESTLINLYNPKWNTKVPKHGLTKIKKCKLCNEKFKGLKAQSHCSKCLSRIRRVTDGTTFV